MGNELVPALDRGLDILEFVSRNKRVGFGELEKEFNLSPSSLNRLLKTLLLKGYLIKDEQKKYHPGLKMISLINTQSIWKPLINKAHPLLKDISIKFNITVLLLGFSGEQILALDKVMHRDNISMQEIGEVINQNLIAPWGFLLLSQYSEERIKEIIEKYELNNDIKTNDLFNNKFDVFIETAQKKEYMDDQAIILNGVRRFAVPLKKANNYIGAIGAGSFVSYVDEKKCY